MTYHLEQLGDERFQQFCQAILASTFPDVQCLPVGQPDGGRDGFLRRKQRGNKGGFIVFQVKFSKDPNIKSSRDVIEELVKTEKAKVEKLIARGATSYYLMTNVAGTSHLSVGSIDKVDEALTSSFGIPTYCWWRDDLERRLDGFGSIKWSFPEVLRAADLLEWLLHGKGDLESKRRSDTIKSYMAFQATRDAQLKFKQVELHKNIVDLFVDVPAKMITPPGTDERSHSLEWLVFIQNNNLHRSLTNDDEQSRHDTSVGALQLLVKDAFTSKANRLVIEGAPGQGKSTVTQYLCQVNRFLLLNRTQDLLKVAVEHRPISARIPFRIDLRDYASWLAGKDPFVEDFNSKRSSDTTPLLESFIAAQVHRYTGAKFTVDDLVSLSNISQLLVVLDGFDEVADIQLRNKIVAEVSDASVRMSENSVSCQIIVTSRPAAFANSPGFPRDEWQHLQILPLTKPVIEFYAGKWLDGRGTDPREKRMITSVLKEKLAQPYVRDLARNPMQLAILLALITVQGASLPNKRTSLYDNYIEIFLNRESEKSNVVRDHRELLVQIHRYLAWKLQCEAEESGAGNIGESRLREVLREYLNTNGHSLDLVQQLFSGMVERVVALVSRVQGTFEFEVQPLREYFAARHLYDTAPYAPAGTSCKGTKPDRFDAISRNFYWLNVTRFYAGCYSSGELASLIDGIDQLTESEQYNSIAYTAELGTTLLNDYVFSQHPRLAAKLADKISTGLSLRLLVSEAHYKRSGQTLTLPANSGRADLVKFAKSLLETSLAYDCMSIAGAILSANSTYEERHSYWLALRVELNDITKWLELGNYFGILRAMPLDEAALLVAELGGEALSRFAIVERTDVLDANPDLWDQLIQGILSQSMYFMPMPVEKNTSSANARLAGRLSTILWPYFLEELEQDGPQGLLVRDAIARSFYRLIPDGEPTGSLSAELESSSLSEVSNAIDHILDQPVNTLLHDASMWSELLEICRRNWGDQWGLYSSAVAYADVVVKQDVPPSDLCDHNVSLCLRAIFAKNNSQDAKWWDKQLLNAERSGGTILTFTLLSLNKWISTGAMLDRSEVLSRMLDALTEDQWDRVATGFSMWTYKNKGRTVLRKADLPKAMSARLACLLLPRLQPGSEKLVWRAFLRSYNGDDAFIWHACSRIALAEANAKPELWNDALAVLSNSYGRGHVYHFSENARAHATSNMPASIARKICGTPYAYPVGMVGAASVSLTAITGGEVVKVANVAERDEWFSS